MAPKEKIHAYAGKILRVNLSNGEIRTEPTLTYARDWVGSEGIASNRSESPYLFRELMQLDDRRSFRDVLLERGY
jgi:aldehyde:ferredoxin oxidoreductase